jgi:signal transduction histidine kinase
MRRPARWDLVLAAVLALVVQQDLWISPDLGHRVGPRPAVACFYLVSCAALAWRRRAPLAVLTTVWLVATIQALAFGAAESLGVFLPPLIALYSAGRWEPARTGVIALPISLLGMAVHELRDPLFDASSGPTYFFWALLAAAWPLGQAWRRREDHIGSLTAQTQELELRREAQLREAVASERARIARELHDVVGHGLSVVVLQLEAALGLLDENRTADLRSRLASSQRSARDALAEMRRLVGLLDEDEPAHLTPQPGLAQLEGLIEDARAAGADLQLVRDGRAADLPAGLDLAAFRVVQEALTNVLRHARPPRACIRVSCRSSELVVEVSDAGASTEPARPGRGIAGMRERVALYGGELEIGPQESGGYRVRARFPLEGARR